LAEFEAGWRLWSGGRLRRQGHPLGLAWIRVHGNRRYVKLMQIGSAYGLGVGRSPTQAARLSE